jgi:hypothetical protein
MLSRYKNLDEFQIIESPLQIIIQKQRQQRETAEKRSILLHRPR